MLISSFVVPSLELCRLWWVCRFPWLSRLWAAEHCSHWDVMLTYVHTYITHTFR
jgi:hypothetical protein